MNNSKDKIRTVVIGLGNIAVNYANDPLISKRIKYSTHIQSIIKHPDFELVAACDKSPSALNNFHNRYKYVDIFKSHEPLLKTAMFDLAVVATNTPSHFQIAQSLIGAGCKFLLLEKPISLNELEARRLVEICKKRKVNLIVNYFRAFNPSYITLLEQIKKGQWGKVQSFGATYSKGVFNNGTHLLQLLTNIFGETKRIEGFGNPTIKGIPAADPTVDVLLTFASGVTGFIQGVNSDFYNLFELDIFFEKGRIQISDDRLEVFEIGDSKIVKSYRGLSPDQSLHLHLDIKPGLMPVYDRISKIFWAKSTPVILPPESFTVVRLASEAIKSAYRDAKQRRR